MRHALFVALLALALGGTAHAAKTETFDLATFTVPPGKRTDTPDMLGFVDSTGATFVQTAIFKSLPGTNDPAKDFAADWAELVAKTYKAKGAPVTTTVDWPGGWKLTKGSAKVNVPPTGDFFTTLSVFTGHGTKVAVQVNFNDERARAKADALVASFQLRAPAPTGVVAAVPAAGTPPFAGRAWHRGSSSYSMWGFDPSPAEFAKVGNQGYSKWTYFFKEDQTYTEVSEFWSMNKYTEYWFWEESGTWSMKDDVLEVRPTEARRVLRDKAGKIVGSPEPAKSFAASYRVQFHYFEGIQEWNLVLTTLDEKRTKRDGEFASNGLFPTSYLFGDPPPPAPK
jgi:hypothetical protein